MKFSAVLLASAAALVSAKKFTLVAIRSGSDIQNTAIVSDGQKLVLGEDGGVPTTYEVKDNVLYANDKPVQFGNGATIEATAGEGTKGVEVDGQNHLYVPNYDWTACAAQGRAYKYTVSSSEDCKQGATPFAPRVMWVEAEESAAAAGNGTAAPVVTKTGHETVLSTALVTVTSCEDDKCHKPTGASSKPPQAPVETTGPAQANGAAAFGVSVGAAGLAAAALLI